MISVEKSDSQAQSNAEMPAFLQGTIGIHNAIVNKIQLLHTAFFDKSLFWDDARGGGLA